MSNELQHRRSSTFVDEYVDKYSALTISWNDDERVHVTFGRDSLEVTSERIVPSPADPNVAILASPRVSAYRNDVASLTMPLEMAEDLAISLLKMIEHTKQKSSDGSEQ